MEHWVNMDWGSPRSTWTGAVLGQHGLGQRRGHWVNMDWDSPGSV